MMKTAFLTVAAYAVAREMAVMSRGNNAIGGEALLLVIIPLIALVIHDARKGKEGR